MAENVTLTKEQFQDLLNRVGSNQSPEQMQKIVAAAVMAARTLNPLEQKALDERLEQEKRRSLMQVEFARIEEDSAWRRKHGCSHFRYPSGHKLAGNPAPQNTPGGEWTVGGQLGGPYGEIATMVCLRCSWVWQWKPSVEERAFIEQNGMLGMTPPAEDRLLSETCLYCHKSFSKKEFAEHNVEKCKAKQQDGLMARVG